MAKRRVYFQAVVSTVVEIDLPDNELDPEAILEAAEEQVDFPDLCNQCGTGLELADDWKATALDGEPLTRIKA